MKLLSIAIPCYNSAAYMENCIRSLLPGGNEVEILIVDDGSTKDNTAQIADEYERRYPGICRAIHQENGGHGAAVNAGLKNATGIFFKVVDSDDWVNGDAYRKVLDTLRQFVLGQDTLDMLITNFVYEKQGAKHKKVMNYNLALPKNEPFTWDDVKVFMAGQYILMHSVIYRTELLRKCGLELPEHTFYVDNIFVYQPLPHVRTMYYLDVNFYRYFIGRSDQSVNEQVMIGRIDQQIRVTKEMRNADVQRGRAGKSVRPRFFCWENVPGVFSSGYPKGADFQLVLQQIIGITGSAVSIPRPHPWGWQPAGRILLGTSFSLAWRVFDSQYWPGTPQRRRRVFLVADFAGQSAPKILFDQESLPGHPASGEGAGPSPPAPAPQGVAGTGWAGQSE